MNKKITLEQMKAADADRYEVKSLENTAHYKIGEILEKDLVERLCMKPYIKVVIR